MSMQLPVIGGHESGFGATRRTDAWWTGPAITLLVFLGFIAYVNVAALVGEHFTFGPYLSPFYSPLLFAAPSGEGLEHAWIGAWPGWWPSFVPASPAVLILAFPALFRFTCYYYRKAYYRAFAGSPPGCAVGPLASSRPYRGETKLMIFQNLHRYALYFALLYIPILYYDAFKGFFYKGQFGIGVGTVIMLINATLIAAYTFGCHSFRHLIGGGDDCMSSCGESSPKLAAWKRATWFNVRHMNFAWASLLWVMVTDLYIRLASMGIITDFNTW